MPIFSICNEHICNTYGIISGWARAVNFILLLGLIRWIYHISQTLHFWQGIKISRYRYWNICTYCLSFSRQSRVAICCYYFLDEPGLLSPASANALRLPQEQHRRQETHPSSGRGAMLLLTIIVVLCGTVLYCSRLVNDSGWPCGTVMDYVRLVNDSNYKVITWWLINDGYLLIGGELLLIMVVVLLCLYRPSSWLLKSLINSEIPPGDHVQKEFYIPFEQWLKCLGRLIILTPRRIRGTNQ